MKEFIFGVVFGLFGIAVFAGRADATTHQPAKQVMSVGAVAIVPSPVGVEFIPEEKGVAGGGDPPRYWPSARRVFSLRRLVRESIPAAAQRWTRSGGNRNM